MHTFKRGILIPGIIIAAALGLIFVEPDRGTTILLAAVSGTMLMLAGVRWLHVIPPVLAAGGGAGLFAVHDPMRSETHFRLAASRRARQRRGLSGVTGENRHRFRRLDRPGPRRWPAKTRFRVRKFTAILFLPTSARNSAWSPRCWSSSRFFSSRSAAFIIALHGTRPVWLPARRRRDLADQLAGHHQHRRRHQRAAEQGAGAAVHQRRRFEPAGHADGVGILFSVARQAAPAKISASDFVVQRQSLCRQGNMNSPAKKALRRHRVWRHGRPSLSRPRRRRSS